MSGWFDEGESVMNGRERILCALDRRQPDRVPVFENYINEPVIMRLAEILLPGSGKLKVSQDRAGEERLEVMDLYCSIVKEMDLDATSTLFSTDLRQVAEGRGRDKFGTLWSLSEHGEPLPIEGPIKEMSDLDGFDMVSKLDVKDFEAVRYVIDRVGRSRAHFVTVQDPFKIAWSLRGSMELFLMDYVLNPELVHRLARIATDYDKAAIDLAADAGADVIFLPGDLAGEQTLLISPKHFREFVKPYEKELVEHSHGRGLRIVKHSDGNMWPILNDILEVGFDGFHPIQPQCMEIGDVKRHVAGKICLLGNIDCRDLLPFGTEKEVEQAVQETIAKAAPGGAYIISSSNTIHPACKAENYIAMVNAAHRYGRY
jgi:uroporphyrinogen decarboxylase